ncbi:MAG: 7TM-DISM domain-containing protein [Methyloprofundus sp.]|nr:7TM-DISM domain-containing protein [Methyloprofundus sp.]
MRFYSFVTLLALMALSLPANSVNNDAHVSPYRLTDISVLVDVSRQKKIEDVFQLYKSKRLFTKGVSGEPINFGFSSDNYWIAASLLWQDKAESAILEVANPKLDKLEVYLFQEQKLVHRYLTGDQLPYSQRVKSASEFYFSTFS